MSGRLKPLLDPLEVAGSYTAPSLFIGRRRIREVDRLEFHCNATDRYRIFPSIPKLDCQKRIEFVRSPCAAEPMRGNESNRLPAVVLPVAKDRGDGGHGDAGNRQARISYKLQQSRINHALFSRDV